MAEGPVASSPFASLIAQQIDSRYGLPKQLRDVLLSAPVLVRLDALEACRFQAAIQAGLMLACDQIDMTKPSLGDVATVLLRRGFQGLNAPCCHRMVCPQTLSLLFGWIPRAIPKVDGRWVLHSRQGGFGAGPGVCPEPTQRFSETDGPTAASPWRTNGSIGSVGWLGPGLPRLLGKAPHWSLRLRHCLYSNSPDGFGFSWKCVEPALLNDVLSYASRQRSFLPPVQRPDPSVHCWSQTATDLSRRDRWANRGPQQVPCSV